MCHVADSFYAAVRALTADEPVKQRLICAYVDHLEALSGGEVPEAIQPRFADLRQAMNAVSPTGKETPVQVSVRKMSQAEAGRLVRSILWMFGELVRAKGTGERLAGREGLAGGEGNRGQAFARPGGNGHTPSLLAP